VSSALPDEGGMEKGVDEHVKIQDKWSASIHKDAGNGQSSNMTTKII
jgi:hypothetical protein